MSGIFEAAMLMCFGISWPLSIYKSLTSKTTKGKSLPFMLFVLFGYVCGITSKIVSDKMTYVFFFYLLNFLMVSFDIFLYARNKRRQDEQERIE